MKRFLSIIAIATLAFTFTSCDKAPASVYTLISDDCGVSWKLIQPGQVIPKRVTQCEIKTTLPAAPMGGESKFKVKFKNGLAYAELSYTYEIVDPVAYIESARYLAKSNADGDEVASNISPFEIAENQVMDKAFKNYSRTALDTADIVEFDQNAFADQMEAGVNELLKKRGVRVSSVDFVPVPAEHTAQAIDAAQAMKIYESKNLVDAGKTIIAAKAGAPRINVNQAPTNNPASED
jgi:hypothetical protein